MSSSSKKTKVSTMKNDKTSKIPARFKYYFYFLLGAIIIGIIIAGIKYFVTERAQRSASVNIEFSYEGAADHLTPNGETFSIDDIKGSFLLSEVLNAEGLSSKYTPESISMNLEVTGNLPSDVIEQIKGFDSLYDFAESRTVSFNNYYPTIYTIKLYDRFDTSISDDDLKKLVNAIAIAYKDYFIKEYAYNMDTSTLDNILVLDNYDYFQRIKLLKMEIAQLKSYAAELYSKYPTFRSNGLSFLDIQSKYTSIENDYIKGIEAYVITDVITISKARLHNQYEYEIALLENEKKHATNNLEDLDALINQYQTDGILYIGSGDSLVKIDNNSKKTYESLINEKRVLTETLIDLDAELDKYEMYLERLDSAATNTTTSNAAATSTAATITEIAKKIKSLESTFEVMLKEFNDTIINEDTVTIGTPRYNGAKILSGGFIVTIIKCVGPLFVIVMCVCCIHALLCALKKQKERA